MGLFYLNNVNHELVRYVDTWYLSYSYKGQSIYNDVFSFLKKLFFTSAHQNDPKHTKHIKFKKKNEFFGNAICTMFPNGI